MNKKLVFVRQKDHNLEEKAVCLSFDLSCEKTRNHIRQFTSSLIVAVVDYENAEMKKRVEKNENNLHRIQELD